MLPVLNSFRDETWQIRFPLCVRLFDEHSSKSIKFLTFTVVLDHTENAGIDRFHYSKLFFFPAYGFPHN
jgi:hypothetical protein